MTTFTEVIGRTLADNAVTHAFGVVANGKVLAVAGLTSHGVRYLPARHEGGAVTMADAYYRATGEVAVRTTGSRPALTNTATGLTDAVKHCSGVLLLCGDTPMAGPRRIDIDQTAFLAALDVPVVRLTDPATVRGDTLRALRLARTETAVGGPLPATGPRHPRSPSPRPVPGSRRTPRHRAVGQRRPSRRVSWGSWSPLADHWSSAGWVPGGRERPRPSPIWASGSERYTTRPWQRDSSPVNPGGWVCAAESPRRAPLP